MYIAWLLMILFGIGNKLSDLSKHFIVAFIVYNFYTCFNYFVLNCYEDYPRFALVLIPPMIVVISSDLNYKEVKENYQKVCITYFTMCIILSIWSLFFKGFRIGEWAEANTYTFEFKNSYSQIISIAVILGIYLFSSTKKSIARIAIISGSIFMYISVFYSQSRTSLLAITVAFAVVSIGAFIAKRNWILFTEFVLLLICLMYIYMYVPFIKNFIDHALLLDRYYESNYDEYTSGRIGYYTEAIDVILHNPLGIGNYYVDNLYLQLLSETGIIGFIIVIPVFVHLILIVYKFKGFILQKKLMWYICVFYIIESFGEAYPPFGPGVTSFMFWLTLTALTKNDDDTRIAQKLPKNR